MKWRIPCTGNRTRCAHCHRQMHTVGMTADAFQLVIVFTIVPVLPLVVLEASLQYGGIGACLTAAMLYAGYPAAFGVLMWLHQSKEAARVCPVARRGN